MDASAMGCETKALERFLPDGALSIVARGHRPWIGQADGPAKRAPCPITLGSAARCILSDAGCHPPDRVKYGSKDPANRSATCLADSVEFSSG